MGSNWIHFATGYLLQWIQTKLSSADLKNLKLFSISVEELFEPLVLPENGDGFTLFKNFFFFLETDLLLTLGKWFYD